MLPPTFLLVLAFSGWFIILGSSWATWVWASGMCLIFFAEEHSLCQVLAEFHHLFPDEEEKGIA
jgi:hypothetical protein